MRKLSKIEIDADPASSAKEEEQKTDRVWLAWGEVQSFGLAAAAPA